MQRRYKSTLDDSGQAELDEYNTACSVIDDCGCSIQELEKLAQQLSPTKSWIEK